MIDERIAERRRSIREGRRRSRLRRTLTVVALVLLVAAVIVVERSPLVGLEEIRVSGTERLGVDEVRDATGLTLGTSTLRLRLGRVEDRVAELPAVRAVDARRLDPLTVIIEVSEREPALVIEATDGHVLLDRAGVVFDVGTHEELPVVALEGELPEVGSTATGDPALANAVRAWRELTGPLRSQVVRYEAGGPDELRLELASGIEVRFGRAHRVDEKARALGVILEDVGETDIREIDVRAPSSPVVIP